MTTVAIDVVVPSVNRLELLDVTLTALLDALDTAGLPTEIVTFVDERPGRPGVDHLLERLELRTLVTGGVGAAAARNAGARAGAAPWIAFIDDDVELNRTALAAACSTVASTGGVAIIGGLRPPAGSPPWLQWAYDDATLTPASSSAAAGALDPVALATGLSLIERGAFERAGGFPDVVAWGWEDALMGLRLERVANTTPVLVREPAISGIHHYTPTWHEWLDRQHRAGARLRALEPTIDAADAARIRGAVNLTGGTRAWLKRAASWVPARAWPPPVNRPLSRAAASAAFARGYREGARG